MKKAAILTVGLVALLFVSCASFPTPSEETKSILVFDRSLDRASSEVSLYVSYHIILDNGTEHRIALDPSDNFLVVEDLPPGTYKVVEMRSRNTTGGSVHSFPLDIPDVVLKAGEISVFPYQFQVFMEKTGKYSFMQRWGFEGLSSADKSALFGRIADKYPEESVMWEPFKSGNY